MNSAILDQQNLQNELRVEGELRAQQSAVSRGEEIASMNAVRAQQEAYARLLEENATMQSHLQFLRSQVLMGEERDSRRLAEMAERADPARTDVRYERRTSPCGVTQSGTPKSTALLAVHTCTSNGY